METLRKVRKRFRDRWQLLELLPAVGAAGLCGYAFVWLVGIFVPLGMPLAGGALAGSLPPAVGAGAASPAGRHALTMLGLVVLVLSGQQLISPISTLVTTFAQQRIDASAQARVMRAAMGPSTMAHLEDPAVLDHVAHAGTPLGPVVTAVPSLAGRWVTASLACVIVARAQWWLGVVVFASVFIQRLYWRRKGLEMQAALRASQSPERRAGYFSELLLTPTAAKETRIFGLTQWVMDRQREQWEVSVTGRWAFFDSLVRDMRWGLPVRFVGYALPYALLAKSAADGRLGLGVFVAAVTATGTAIGHSSFAVEDIQLEHMIAAFPAIRSLEATAAGQPSGGPGIAHGLPSRDIRLVDLTFAYPGASVPVYDGLDLTIRAGESLAIVGANGVGKTTLVKLLSGLYVPTGGRIEVDGTDLAEIDPEVWRRQLGVIFQDFARYALSARDNVGFGAPHRAPDREALERAARRAGALEIINDLPDGWDTVLSRQFTDGVDLSGGQWQRIALARAMYAVESGAQVLVLDEPTAQLDIRAEAELFGQFLDLTQGLTTILVSHRFSTVRQAERIVVVEAGRVVEDGSHEQLMELGGRYATMFSLQAGQFGADHNGALRVGRDEDVIA